MTWLRSQDCDWTGARVTTLLMWKNYLAVTPYRRTSTSTKLRSANTIGANITAVVEFYKWAGAAEYVPRTLVAELTDDQWVPAGRYDNDRRYRRVAPAKALRTRRARVGTGPQWLEHAEDRAALLELDLRPRDRFLVDLLYFTGMRIGEALSLYRSDLHFREDNRAHACPTRGPHLHIRRNDSRNGARAKSLRMVPVSAQLALTYQYLVAERLRLVPADDTPNVFVSLSGPTAGAPLSYGAAVELFKHLSTELDCRIRPHMLRHTRATLWIRGIDGPKVDPDVVRVLLGHLSPKSTDIYSHASATDLRAAVEAAVHLVQPEVPQ